MVLGPLGRVHAHPEACWVALRDLSAVANRGFLPLLLPEYVTCPLPPHSYQFLCLVLFIVVAPPYVLLPAPLLPVHPPPLHPPPLPPPHRLRCPFAFRSPAAPAAAGVLCGPKVKFQVGCSPWYQFFFCFLVLAPQLLGVGGCTRAAAAGSASEASAESSVSASYSAPSRSASAAGPCVVARGGAANAAAVDKPSRSIASPAVASAVGRDDSACCWLSPSWAAVLPLLLPLLPRCRFDPCPPCGTCTRYPL